MQIGNCCFAKKHLVKAPWIFWRKAKGGSIRRTCDPTAAAAAGKDKGEAVNRPQVRCEKLHRVCCSCCFSKQHPCFFGSVSHRHAAHQSPNHTLEVTWDGAALRQETHPSIHPYLVFERRVDVQQGSGLAVIANGALSFKGPKARPTASVRSPGKIKALWRWYVGPRLHLLVHSVMCQ